MMTIVLIIMTMIPIVVTLVGIVIAVSDVQSWKAAVPKIAPQLVW